MKQLVTFTSLTSDYSNIFGLISDVYAIYAFVFMAASLAMTRVLVSDWYGKLINALQSRFRLISFMSALAVRVPVVVSSWAYSFRRLITF